MTTRARGTAVAWLVAALALSIPLGAAAEYRFLPGDILRVTVASTPELTAAAAIDNDGYLRLPRFERVKAAGLTLESLTAELRARAAGRLVRRFDSSGAPTFITVSAEDLSVSVDAYRPFYVLGAVATPGASPFRPGVSVRAAVAAAGGISAVSGASSGDSAAQIAPRLQADFRTAQLERARLMAETWRIEADLGLASADEPPTPADLGIDATTGAAILARQKELLELSRQRRDNELELIGKAIDQTRSRIAILADQSKRQSEAVAADDEEMGRVRRLLERGVVNNERMLDIRRAQVLSSTRLLSTQNDLERVELDLTRLEAELRDYDSRRREGLLGALATVRVQLEAATIRLASARETLEVNGITAVSLSAGALPPPEFLIHRSIGGETRSFVPSLEDLLEPGDVLEVTLATPAP